MVQQETLIFDGQTQRFVDALAAQGGKPIYTLSYADARKVLEDLQAAPIAKLPAAIEDKDLPAGPGGHVSIRIYRPQNVTGMLPAVVYIHGGGWILGSKNTHDRLLRDLTGGTGMAFVFVNYTPSPEAQYPIPTEQAYAVAKYVAEHGAGLSLDGTKLAVAGDSVGGCMAAVVAQLAKERGGPELRYQAMFYPVTNADFSTRSYSEFADGPWLTTAAMQWFWDAYAPNKSDRKKNTVSPLQASIDQLKGLPPALLITDENDVLRDEGEEYARKLIHAGVNVTAVRFLSTIHDFMMLNPLSGTPPAKGAIELACGKLRTALKGAA